MGKRAILNVALVVVLVSIGGAAVATVRSSSSSASTTETVATAKRGTVLESVTSTGNVEAPTSLSLSFQQSGEITAIYVKAGDHVTKGEKLAKVDDSQQSGALASAKASLASAQAALAALQRGETSVERVSDAASIASSTQSVASAQQGLTHSQQNQSNNKVKYQQAIDQAQSSLTSAQRGASTAQTNLDQAKSALSSLQTTADPSHSSSESIAATITRYQLDEVSCSANVSDPSYHPSDAVDCSQIKSLLSFAQSVDAAQSSLTQANNQVTTAQLGVTSATQNQTSGELQDTQAVENAFSQLASAQLQYNSSVAGVAVKQQAPKPEQLAQSEASVTSAKQQVTTAQKNEDDTTLRAPVAGTVASISGIVGQESGSGASGTGSSSSTGSTSSASSSSSSSSASSSSSGFITLTDVDALDVKVGFTESDASKVRIGQAATITLAALPNRTFTGHVVSLDTDSTLVSNVVTYYAQVAFDKQDRSVKPGMTASVNIVLDKRDDVVTLPTSAVSTTGTTQTVVVRSNGDESTRTITIGLRGDNAVEIVSGLEVGDQVVTTTAASTGSNDGFPGGGGPPGGGGLGGGLGGGGRP
jgi:macrolide-specific efflux system membrane fusion protein